MKFKHICFFAALILSTAWMFAEPQATQSTPKKKAARVITDDDLPSTSSSTRQGASEPAATTEKPASSGLSNSGTATPASKTQKNDNPQVAALQARLDELNSDEANLINGNESLKQDLAKEEDPERREVFQNMLTNRLRSLERTRSERSDINQKIDTLKKKK
jgi:hypothetical protein